MYIVWNIIYIKLLRLADSSRLLLEYVNSVFIFHFQHSRCISFIYRLPIKSKPDLSDLQALSLTVCFHQLTQWCLLLYLELYN